LAAPQPRRRRGRPGSGVLGEPRTVGGRHHNGPLRSAGAPVTARPHRRLDAGGERGCHADRTERGGNRDPDPDRSVARALACAGGANRRRPPSRAKCAGRHSRPRSKSLWCAPSYAAWWSCPLRSPSRFRGIGRFCGAERFAETNHRTTAAGVVALAVALAPRSPVNFTRRPMLTRAPQATLRRVSLKWWRRDRTSNSSYPGPRCWHVISAWACCGSLRRVRSLGRGAAPSASTRSFPCRLAPGRDLQLEFDGEDSGVRERNGGHRAMALRHGLALPAVGGALSSSGRPRMGRRVLPRRPHGVYRAAGVLGGTCPWALR